MAAPGVYEFDFRYSVNYNGATNTLTIVSQAATIGNRIITESTDEGFLVEPGEELTLVFQPVAGDPAPSSTVFYVGRVPGIGLEEDHILVGFKDEGEFSSYVLLSNTTGLEGSKLVNEAEVYCLLFGTEVSTSLGSIRVEDLIPGDRVLNSQGMYSPLRWVGVQTVAPLFSGKSSWPVKISKDALGENTPNQDLYLSQDHAVFLDGVLICAEALVNGSTITFEKPTESSIKYYGLDLGPATIHPVHNLPVGSLGAVPREYFDNYQEWLESGHELIDEPLMFPRVKNASQLPNQIRVSISA